MDNRKMQSKRYKTKSVMGRIPGYLFQIMTIYYIIHSIYLLIWNEKFFYDDLEVRLFLFVLLFSFIYLFLRFPLWIFISDRKFMPFIPQSILEFITRKFRWVDYDEIIHVKIFKMDGKTFRMDLELDKGKTLYMHFLDLNPELAEAYEKVFRMKLDENKFTVIEKHSEAKKGGKNDVFLGGLSILITSILLFQAMG